jgi:putative SOS response-associated peptidase YedK
MSGRYALISPGKVIEDEFQVRFTFDYHPRLNAFPSVEMPVITTLHPDQVMRLRWGLIPYWARNDHIAHYTFNARAENVFTKPSYRVPIVRRRCLVPANFYFEWRYDNKQAHPYLIYPVDQIIFAFAGIWDTWRNPANDQIHRTFSIITVPSHPPLDKLSDRSPVMLRKDQHQKWLDLKLEKREIRQMLHHYDSRKVNSWPVNSGLNNPSNEDSSLLEPVGQALSDHHFHPGEWLGSS